MSATTTLISADDFDSTYVPIPSSEQDGTMLREYDEVKDHDMHHVWSLVDGDHFTRTYARAGFAVVNVFGYCLTERPWVTGEEEAIWTDVPPHRDELERHGLTDDITTCPQCGVRTEFTETGGPHDEQEHTCPNPTCGFIFIGFFDPEDFDADGNFVSPGDREEAEGL